MIDQQIEKTGGRKSSSGQDIVLRGGWGGWAGYHG
jgi:hypothetical protein